jgi:hypothetical protein
VVWVQPLHSRFVPKAWASSILSFGKSRCRQIAAEARVDRRANSLAISVELVGSVCALGVAVKARSLSVWRECEEEGESGSRQRPQAQALHTLLCVKAGTRTHMPAAPSAYIKRHNSRSLTPHWRS